MKREKKGETGGKRGGVRGRKIEKKTHKGKNQGQNLVPPICIVPTWGKKYHFVKGGGGNIHPCCINEAHTSNTHALKGVLYETAKRDMEKSPKS